MKCKTLKTWLPLLLAVALTGCAGMKEARQPMTCTPTTFESGKYTPKAENFQIIMDASQTMANRGGRDFQSTKNFVSAVNASLPADLGANTGLRSFGHSERQSKNLTDLVYGMAKYSRDDLQKGLEKVKYAGGTSPLGAAITAAGVDLEKASGTSVLLIVSDATQNVMDNAPAAAQALKAKMGDKLCIYTVWVGDDVAGQKVLEKVATVGACGFATSAAALTEQGALAAFVEKVFLTKKPAPAPVAAPAPVPVPVPAPIPPPAPVKQKEIITLNLLFDFDKATIKDDMVPVLEQAKTILNEDPNAAFIVSGHADSVGADVYNQGLSERRAVAVKNWLVTNGISASRLETVGYGETQPKFDNATSEGRKLNRRVEIQTK